MCCMLRPLLIGIAFFHSYKLSFGQQYFYNDRYYENSWLLECGAGGGFMNCLTDLGGRHKNARSLLKDWILPDSKPAFVFSITLTNNYWLALRLAYLLGTIQAGDIRQKNEPQLPAGRQLRNLHFRSTISELSLQAELYPGDIPALQGNQSTLFEFLSPSLIIGIGCFSFDPRARWEGQWARLQPLHTEGQGFPEYPKNIPYRLRQINIPAGLGARYELTALLTLKMECVYRILFTDYLDDVSKTYIDPQLFEKNLPPEKSTIAKLLADRSNELITGFYNPPGAIRGNPGKDDSYLATAINLSVALNRKRRN